MNCKANFRANTYAEGQNKAQSSPQRQQCRIRSVRTTSLSSQAQEESQYQCFLTFVTDIKNEILLNKDTYGQFLDVRELTSILEEFQRLYIDHGSAQQIVRLILQFLSYCRNKSGALTTLQTSFKDNYKRKLPERWQKIRDPIYFLNKGHLKLLSYTVRQPQSGRHEYKTCFECLNFDFSLQQCKQVAETVKKMCKQDIRAFCYLTNYFLSSCYGMEQKNVTILEIRDHYTSILEELCQLYRPAPLIEAEDNQFRVHPSIKYPERIPKFEINLEIYETKEERQFALDTFIMSRAEESIRRFEDFTNIMKDICYKNDGFRFKAGLKIKDKTQSKALTRIKEKMLSDIFSQVQLQQKLSPHTNESILDFIDLYSYTTQEQIIYHEKMNKLFDKIKGPIVFKISDMLRGKCMFTSIEKINQCCSDILATIQNDQTGTLKLIQIDNRLKKGTSDLVLKILLGSIITELQLVIHLNSAQYEFSHKLYELQRSKFFTPFTQLSILNQQISNDYFLEVKALIMANLRKQGYDYGESVTYKEVLRNFKAFCHKLSIKMNLFQPHPNEIDIRMMQRQQLLFKEILSCKMGQVNIIAAYNEEIDLSNGIYCFEMKNYVKALENLYSVRKEYEKQKGSLLAKQSSIRKMDSKEREKTEIYIKALGYEGKTYLQMGRYEQAQQKYKSKLQLQEKIDEIYSANSAETMFQLGRIYDRKGLYQQALEYYYKCLEIQQKVKGNESIDIASTLNNIGSTFSNQGKYPEALENYQKCLQIQEKVKGKGSAQTALTLNNIGIVYSNQGNFPKALEYFQRCLQIQEKVKGRGHIETASTLNNIGSAFNDQCNYQKALQYYLRCLEIQQKAKGKGNVDTALTLNNIGSVYKNQRNYPKALEYFQRCLQIEQSVKGAQTIDITLILNNIGIVYDIQKDYQKALKYYERCLSIQQKVKGQDSIDTALTLHNIGIVYSNQQNYIRSLQYFEKCLQIQQKVKGKGSIDTALTINNIGLMHKNQNETLKALEYCKQSLGIYENLRIVNPNYGSNLINLGFILFEMGKWEEAAFYFQKSIEVFQKYGLNDRSKESIQWISRCLKNTNQVQKLSEILLRYNLNIV